MRVACLQATSDAATPLLMRAALHAVDHAYSEFTASLVSPTKILILVLFLASSIFLPVSSVLRALVPPDEGSADSHIVLVNGDSQFSTPRQRFRRALKGLRMRKQKYMPTPLLEDLEEIDDEEGGGGMISIDLGGHKKDL